MLKEKALSAYIRQEMDKDREKQKEAFEFMDKAKSQLIRILTEQEASSRARELYVIREYPKNDRECRFEVEGFIFTAYRENHYIQLYILKLCPYCGRIFQEPVDKFADIGNMSIPDHNENLKGRIKKCLKKIRS